MEISEQQINEAVKQLSKSNKGVTAMHDLLAFMDNAGLTIDASNQTAIVTLLIAAWGSHAGTVLDQLRVATT